MDKSYITFLLTQTGNNTLHNPHKVDTETHYVEVCTVHLVQFIIQTNKCTIYIYIYIRGVTGGTDQTSGGCSLC